MQLVYLVGSIALGGTLAVAAIWAAWRSTRATPNASQGVVAFEPVAQARRPQADPGRVPPGIRVAPRPPPPASPRGHAERAPAMLLTLGVEMRDAEFERRAPSRGAAAPPPMRQAPPLKSWAQQVREDTKPAVPTEWARRQVGPVEAGRVAGACGGCGTRLSASDQRPLRIACPVCGRNKLVA